MVREQEITDRLQVLYDDAVRNYQANGGDPMSTAGAYDAGVIEGIRRAIEQVALAGG